jgi:hypothetical protein
MIIENNAPKNEDLATHQTLNTPHVKKHKKK